VQIILSITQKRFCREGTKYDLILGINGNRSISDYHKALAPKGTYLMVGGSDRQIFQAMLLGGIVAGNSGQKLGSFLSRNSREDLIGSRTCGSRRNQTGD
jgi:hypothetical protein